MQPALFISLSLCLLMLVSPKQPWSIPFPASGPSNHPVISPSLSWEVLWIYFLLTHLPGCWPRASCALVIAPQKTWVKGSLSLIKSLNKPEAEFHGKGNILEIKYRKNSRKMWRSIWMKNLEKKPKSSYWLIWPIQKGGLLGSSQKLDVR